MGAYSKVLSQSRRELQLGVYAQSVERTNEPVGGIASAASKVRDSLPQRFPNLIGFNLWGVSTESAVAVAGGEGVLHRERFSLSKQLLSRNKASFMPSRFPVSVVFLVAVFLEVGDKLASFFADGKPTLRLWAAILERIAPQLVDNPSVAMDRNEGEHPAAGGGLQDGQSKRGTTSGRKQQEIAEGR